MTNNTLNIEKGILPVVINGLGNQMFIVAAGFVAHKHSKSPLYILQNPSENNYHNIKKYNYNESIFKYFGIHLPYSLNDYNIHFPDYNKYYQSNPFTPWFPESIIPGTILGGSFFQFYPPLEPFEDELRELFLKGLCQIREKLPDYSNCAFLHIRRGDYLHNLKNNVIQPIEYYKACVSYLRESGQSGQSGQSDLTLKIIVFSDDIEWVKSQEFFTSDIFEISNSTDELETLAIMSKCTKGAICANSTFSWWGAFLGAHANRSPVFVPKKWTYFYILNLFPKEWIIVG